MEVAAATISKVKSVHVIGRSEVPFKESLGKEMGERVQELFESKGVIFHMKTSVKNYIGYNNRLSEIELADGQKLKADICVMAMGSKTNVEFLTGSNIEINSSNGAIEVNEVSYFLFIYEIIIKTCFLFKEIRNKYKRNICWRRCC